MEYVFDNKTLVPINVNRSNYDDVATDFLTHYGCAQYIGTPMAVPIFDIARKRMGLTVSTDYHLSPNCDVLGAVIFVDGHTEIYDKNKKHNIKLATKKGTILVDCAIGNEGRKNNTMAHECVHWHIHRHYFLNLYNKTKKMGASFRCPVKKEDIERLTRDEERMEVQARGIAPRILMPKIAVTKKINELIATRTNLENDIRDINIFREVIEELAAFFHVSKISAKYRMIDLGYITQEEGEKLYNYNNKIEEEFYEHPLVVKANNRPLTRHISLEHAFLEYNRNKGFREMLQGGLFKYVENAFVINDPKYITYDENGKYNLTDYALKYPEECTILFQYAIGVEYIETDLGKFSPAMLGYLRRYETEYKKLPRYYPNVQNDAVFDVAIALDKVKEDFDSFVKERTNLSQATDFWERVEQIKDAKGLKNNIFKERSGLDDSTISRIKLKKTTVTLRVAIATCFGLDLDIHETRKLLALAKLALNDDNECLAYEFVINNFQFCPLFEKNEVLKHFGVEPIGVRSKKI